MIYTMGPGQGLELRPQLEQLVGQALALSRWLEITVAPQGRQVGRDAASGYGRGTGSRPPWLAGPAHLLTELHTGVRAAEQALQHRLGITPIYARGGSSLNTVYALGALNDLAVSAADADVARLIGWLAGWTNRAWVLLGERDEPHRLPRSPGGPEPRCPYCEKLTLRFWPGRGLVRCVNPTCQTDDGKRPAATMVYSNVAMDWVLAWNDGVVGIPA
jgi:hypothetical protein